MKTNIKNANIFNNVLKVKFHFTEWFDNCDASISILYYIGWSVDENDNIKPQYVLENDMIIDYEILTDSYSFYPQLREFCTNF